MPLAMNVNTFTHYDLHLENVLLYEPVKGKYIQYHYHLNANTEITFKCCYIAKIIDYGRSYFVDKYSPNIVTKTSSNIRYKVCNIKACDSSESKCGDDYGYGILAPEDPPGNFFFISSSTRNMSHDLRLLYEIKMYYMRNIQNKKMKMLIC